MITELQYIEPFFKSLGPKAVPVVGREHLRRFTCTNTEWKAVIGLITAHTVHTVKVRAMYRVYKELENRRWIIFCRECGTIIGSRVIDGFNRPWENVCNQCMRSDK